MHGPQDWPNLQLTSRIKWLKLNISRGLLSLSRVQSWIGMALQNRQIYRQASHAIMKVNSPTRAHLYSHTSPWKNLSSSFSFQKKNHPVKPKSKHFTKLKRSTDDTSRDVHPSGQPTLVTPFRSFRLYLTRTGRLGGSYGHIPVGFFNIIF